AQHSAAARSQQPAASSRQQVVRTYGNPPRPAAYRQAVGSKLVVNTVGSSVGSIHPPTSTSTSTTRQLSSLADLRRFVLLSVGSIPAYQEQARRK
uniref:Uncharacterized protein n=1 Tax=Anopheles albimanus TaxID=7167 RepID=A0A182FYK8_ANOAL